MKKINIGLRFYDDYVVIVPHSSTFEVFIQKQYKPGVKKVCYGFPAGFIKDGEQPIEAAKRELFEEAGVKAKVWKEVGTYFDNVSVSPAKFTIFFASGLERAVIHPNPDIDEAKIMNLTVQAKTLKKYKMPGACMALARELFLSSISGKL